ncbi:helix-turn-helix transcriptional regulator [Rhizobium sp. Root1204]|uniref:helix-turn-helix domain-containing protein n=1 Tax=Rhizobium sp. Root1204 TaxID=1736428 RepID=UPI000712C6E1|nr:helix-turn-helix transcriptional regulator [Rhizobium sp. Root1204]KQV41215.1 transcriptional regulator [Rhizobium sp. Root1204]
MINLKSHDNKEITGAQIRAARALVRWSAKDLAQAARIGVATVSRAEVEEGRTTLTTANLKAIRLALESAGIEFIPENGGGVGVRFRDRT